MSKFQYNATLTCNYLREKKMSFELRKKKNIFMCYLKKTLIPLKSAFKIFEYGGWQYIKILLQSI